MEQAFGKYTLLRKLATGGMAEVWLARQTGIERFQKKLVIKRILPGLADEPDFVELFLNEARIAAQLSHPNIAQVYDLGEVKGTYFLAMEFVDGEDLGQVIRTARTAGQRIPLPIGIRIASLICEGLHYAHTSIDDTGLPRKVVHRDISPRNILVGFDGSVKIVDFGIARAADSVPMTKSGYIRGKLPYMAPEQADGRAIDHRADVFAIGITLYELLTDKRPLKRDSEAATLKAVLECNISSPSKVADVPPELDPIVMRALAQDRNDRYVDARRFGMALEQFLIAKQWLAGAAQIAEMMSALYPDRRHWDAKVAEEGRNEAHHDREAPRQPPTGSWSPGTAVGKSGKYIVRRQLGAAGMAEVYLCSARGQEGFEKNVAVKRIRPMFADDLDFVEMFINEAQLAAILNHRNVVQLYDFDQQDGVRFIVMEYVRGRSLAQVLWKGKESMQPIHSGLAAAIADEVAQGLDHAHTAKGPDGRLLNIVHRDVSPENVLVSVDGTVKLTDFGLAKSFGSDTNPGVIRGKLCYMSPEQMRGQLTDHRSDIFSLGVVLWEMLTGARLFDYDEQLDKLRWGRFKSIVPPQRVNRDIPDEIGAVAMKALEDRPDERFQSAWEMHRALRSALMHHARDPDDIDPARYLNTLYGSEIAQEVKHDQEPIPTSSGNAEVDLKHAEQPIDKITVSMRKGPAVRDDGDPTR